MGKRLGLKVSGRYQEVAAIRRWPHLEVRLYMKNMNNQLRNLACETNVEKVKSRLSILLTSADPSLRHEVPFTLLIKHNRNAAKIQDDCINGLNMAQW